MRVANVFESDVTCFITSTVLELCVVCLIYLLTIDAIFLNHLFAQMKSLKYKQVRVDEVNKMHARTICYEKSWGLSYNE